MYLFYLNGMLLPVTPEKINTKIGTNNKTINLANGGEASLLTFPKLTEYSFEFELYHNIKNISYRASDITPKQVLDMLEKLVGSKAVVPFVVVRKMGKQRRFDVETKVTIENYDVEEDANNNSDLMVKIELKQFREFKTKKLLNPKIQNPPEPAKNTPKPTPSKPVVYKVKNLKILAYYLNVRNNAGVKNKSVAVLKKGNQVMAYVETKVGSTTWYKIKHAKGPGGWAWISGNPKYTKVIG